MAHKERLRCYLAKGILSIPEIFVVSCVATALLCWLVALCKVAEAWIGYGFLVGLRIAFGGDNLVSLEQFGCVVLLFSLIWGVVGFFQIAVEWAKQTDRNCRRRK